MIDMNTMNESITHIKEHVDFPASKDDILEACSNMSHVTEEEKSWLMEHLPDQTYNSSNEVLDAMRMEMK